MRTYKPRRAGKRWLKDAPEYILDVFDDPRPCDRYTVLFGGSLLNYTQDGAKTVWIDYLGMSGSPTHPQGFSQCGELTPCEAVAYRYRNGRFRVKWLDLPEAIRKHVIARVVQQ